MFPRKKINYHHWRDAANGCNDGKAIFDDQSELFVDCSHYVGCPWSLDDLTAGWWCWCLVTLCTRVRKEGITTLQTELGISSQISYNSPNINIFLASFNCTKLALSLEYGLYGESSKERVETWRELGSIIQTFYLKTVCIDQFSLTWCVHRESKYSKVNKTRNYFCHKNSWTFAQLSN